jgi:hypothetical protein
MKTAFELDQDRIQGSLNRLTQNCPYGKPRLEAHVDINGYMWIVDYSYGHGRFTHSFVMSDEEVDEFMYGNKAIDFDGELYMALFEMGIGIEAAFAASLIYNQQV